MKNKFLVILKNSLMNNYKLKKSNKKKLLVILLLVIYVAATLFMMFKDFFGNIYEKLVIVNLTSYYLTILFSLTSLFSIFFSIFSSKNALFENKDNGLLFSLPIKKRDILLSRLVQILLYDFALSLFIIIPGLYVYFVNEIPSFKNVIVILLLVIFSSIIPTILSSLFGYLVAFISSKFKKKNIIEFISYILFIGIYMYLINNGNKLLELFINNPKMLTKILKYLFFPIYLINLSITKDNLVYVLLYVLFNVIIIYVFIILLNKLYYRIIVKLNTMKVSSKFRMKKMVNHSKMSSLIRKEIKRYLGSAIYVFNTSFGVIMLLIASIASLFYKCDKLIEILDLGTGFNAFMFVFYIVLFAVSFSITTNSSISIERNNFWILKMLPLTTKEVFMAKKSVNLILVIPCLICSLTLFKISNYINLKEMVFLMGIGLLISMVIANFGLICNLLFPKFDAPNDTVIVKQSMASMMGIMIPMILVIIYIVVINALNISQNLILIITTCICTILLIITYFVLNTWGVKKYRTLG